MNSIDFEQHGNVIALVARWEGQANISAEVSSCTSLAWIPRCPLELPAVATALRFSRSSIKFPAFRLDRD
jgi:hypothetical protein